MCKLTQDSCNKHLGFIIKIFRTSCWIIFFAYSKKIKTLKYLIVEIGSKLMSTFVKNRDAILVQNGRFWFTLCFCGTKGANRGAISRIKFNRIPCTSSKSWHDLDKLWRNFDWVWTLYKAFFSFFWVAGRDRIL